MLDIASEDEVFCDENEEPFARIKNNGHFEILPVKSKKYRNWLSRKFFKLRGEPARLEEINDALRIVEAQAVFEGKRHELFVRVAPEGKNVWVDLSDDAWRAIRISEDGWEIVDNPPIIFRRYSRASSQVEPLRGGDIGLLRPFLNLKNESLWKLLVAFLVASLMPDIPHPYLWGMVDMALQSPRECGCSYGWSTRLRPNCVPPHAILSNGYWQPIIRGW